MTQPEAHALTAWTCGMLAALLVAIFGTLALAALKGAKTPPACDETRPCERCESGAAAERCARAAGCEADHERTKPPPPPQNPRPPLVIDLNVNTVAAPTVETRSTTPGGSGGGATTQTVTVNGVPVAPVSSDGKDGAGATTQSVVVNVPPPTTVGGGGGDVVVLFDREKTIEKPAEPACCGVKNRCGGEKPRPPCPDGDEPDGGSKPREKAVKLGHVEFEHGSRRFAPSHPDLIGSILEELGGRTGPLLVVGHGDRCGQRRLAERRAKKSRRELRRLLRKRLAWKDGRIRVHSQAAGAGTRALEGRCAEELYRTAGVYLIENLS